MCAKVAELEKTGAVARGTLKDRERKSATAANYMALALEAERTHAKTLHVWLVEVTAQSKVNTKEAQANFQVTRKRVGKAEKETKLVTAKLEDVQ